MPIYSSLDRFHGAAKPTPNSTLKAGLNRRSPSVPEKLASTIWVMLVTVSDVRGGLALGFGGDSGIKIFSINSNLLLLY